MSAAKIAELARLQHLREQRARGRAATAQRSRAECERAVQDAGEALDRALAHDANCRAMSRFCVDRIGLAAQGVVQAVTRADKCQDDAHAARSAHGDALAQWRDASNRERHLSQRAAEMRRREDRKAGDRKDLAAITERNAMRRSRT